MKFKKGQTVYKQGFVAMPRCYIVLYGQFEYHYQQQANIDGVFGDKCGVGFTIGEENLF